MLTLQQTASAAIAVLMGSLLLGPRAARAADPGPRACHAAAYARSLGGVVVFGGALQCGRDVLPDDTLWLWNGSRWSALDKGGPSAREDALLVHDTQRDVLVLYGGRRDGVVHTDTWEWKQARGWREIATTTNPGPIEHASATYDPRRGRVVLFGGGVGRTHQASTWEWDGTRWTRQNTSITPAARVAHSMTWSASMQSVLLYGGFSNDRQFTDLWRWNGTRWTLVDSAGPTYSEGPSLVDDGQGPLIAGPGLADAATVHTWRFDGRRWLPLGGETAGPTPALLIGAILVYDQQRQAYVLTGGAAPAAARIRIEEFRAAPPRSPRDSVDALRRVIEVVAHDSMLGRPTPSPQLDRAARFIAAELARAGLRGLGDEGGFLQWYPVVETVLDEDEARVEFGPGTTWRFGKDYFWAGGGGGDPAGELRGPAVLVTGRVTRENASTLDVGGKVALYVPSLDARGGVADLGAVFALGGAGAKGVLVASGRPATLWERLRTDRDELKPSVAAAWPVWTADPARPRPAGWFAFRPFLQLWDGRLAAFARQAGLDTLMLLNVDAPPAVRPLGFDATLHFARRLERVAWAPNVVAVIEGSDPVLKHEYVVVTAHLDGLGQARGAPPGPGMFSMVPTTMPRVSQRWYTPRVRWPPSAHHRGAACSWSP